MFMKLTCLRSSISVILEDLLLEDYRIYFHVTEYENIPNILRKGLIANQRPLFGTLGGYAYKKGHVYIGNAVDAMNYGLQINKPCIIALKKEEEHLTELDEAVLPMLWWAYHNGLPDILKAYKEPIGEFYKQYDIQNDYQDHEKIMQDAVDGRWDSLIKDPKLVEILSYHSGGDIGARSYAPVRSKTSFKPESIIGIWQYKHLPEEEEGDPEEEYWDSVSWSKFAGPNEIISAFEESPDWKRIY